MNMREEIIKKIVRNVFYLRYVYALMQCILNLNVIFLVFFYDAYVLLKVVNIKTISRIFVFEYTSAVSK